MSLLRIDEVVVCPWALREGILLRRLESATGWQTQGTTLPVLPPRPAVPPTQTADAAVVPIDRARSGPAGWH
jgi:exopolyphosphatase/guanosine-5'-triphosphate,3'-diphosphate pyrophosphatase